MGEDRGPIRPLRQVPGGRPQTPLPGDRVKMPGATKQGVRIGVVLDERFVRENVTGRRLRQVRVRWEPGVDGNVKTSWVGAERVRIDA